MGPIVLNGFFVGLIYSMLGVGLVVAYRGSRVINFAQAETGMVGAFIFVEVRFGTSNIGLGTDRGLWPALPIALVAGAVIGAATEALVVRPLRNAPRIRPLVGTLAVGALLFTFAARRWGLDPHPFKPLVEGDGTEFMGLLVRPSQILVLVISIAVLVGLVLLYRFTPFGLRLRAIALDPEAAAYTGVNVNRTSRWSWALVGALAVLSTVLISPLVAFSAATFATLAIRGLAAAMLGGLSNVGAVFVAGLAIGVAESVVAFKSPITGSADILVAMMLLAVMMIRPQGLGRAVY